MRRTLGRILIPVAAACLAVTASLAQTLSQGSRPLSSPALPSVIPLAGAAPASLPAVGPTEAQLHHAFKGKTLVRTDTRGFHRTVALHGSHGRLITGPALAALLSEGPVPEPPATLLASAAETGAAPSRPACTQADSLARLRCWDSLAHVRASEPRALREERRRAADTLEAGEEPKRRQGGSTYDDGTPEEVQEARNRGYWGRFWVDMGREDWDWSGDDWAVVIYVVVGIIVVGAFVLVGGKALYDLVVNRYDFPVFREVGARYSYSALDMRDGGGSLFRNAHLTGGRFAFGVERDMLTLGLALEGGWIDLSLRGLDLEDPVEYQGGYLLGGPMVRFGRHEPMAVTLEFLNGTSDHGSIGLISMSRLAVAGKTAWGPVVGAHLGAVFLDLRFTDGLVFRRGDFNRDLSLLFGVDLAWEW